MYLLNIVHNYNYSAALPSYKSTLIKSILENKIKINIFFQIARGTKSRIKTSMEPWPGTKTKLKCFFPNSTETITKSILLSQCELKLKSKLKQHSVLEQH